MLIPLDLSRPGRNAGALRAAIGHLAGGGSLIVFPAGEVSEAAWNPGVLRLLRSVSRVKVTVMPMHLCGRARVAFRLAPHPALRMLMLPRELLCQRGAEVLVSVGQPIEASRVTGIEECVGVRNCLGSAVALAASRSSIPHRREIAKRCRALSADRKLGESGDLTVYIARAPGDSPRSARDQASARRAKGTDRECDRDAFDEHYWRLFLRNNSLGEIAGAYRLALTDEVRATFGVAGCDWAILVMLSVVARRLRQILQHNRDST